MSGEDQVGIIATLLSYISGVALTQDLKDLLLDMEVRNIIESLTALTKDVFIPVASVLICIYFCMDLIDKMTTDRFNAEEFVRMLIKLAVEIIVVSNASEICLGIVNFSMTFTNAVASVGNTSVTMTIANNLGIIKILVTIIVMIIPFFFSVIVLVAGYYMVFSYEIEFSIYVVAAPIGLADLLSQGVHSNGVRYLKRLLALSIQGAIMILILVIGMMIQQAMIGTLYINIDSNVLANIGPIFATCLACLGVELGIVGTLGTAKSIANSLIGA